MSNIFYCVVCKQKATSKCSCCLNSTYYCSDKCQKHEYALMHKPEKETYDAYKNILLENESSFNAESSTVDDSMRNDIKHRTETRNKQKQQEVLLRKRIDKDKERKMELNRLIGLVKERSKEFSKEKIQEKDKELHLDHMRPQDANDLYNT